MSRKIKFSFMMQHEETGTIIDKRFTLQEIMEAEFNTRELSRYNIFAIREYTGLKDKNGKEIYEGDILECHGFWDIRIEFENGVFWVRDLDGVRYSNKILNVPIAEFDVSHYEIYANIYENPELLEVAK